MHLEMRTQAVHDIREERTGYPDVRLAHRLLPHRARNARWHFAHIAALGAVAQGLVHQHQCQHGFGDGNGADTDAGIVASLGDDFGRLPCPVDTATRHEDAGRRLERHRHHDRLARGDTAEDAARMIGEETVGAEFVTVLGAPLRYRSEAITDLHALHRVDGHHRRGEFAVELAVDRLTPPGRYAVGDDGDLRAHRVARLAQGVHIGLEFGNLRRVWPEERAGLDRAHVEPARDDLSDLGHVPPDGHAVTLGQPLLGDDTGGNAHGGLAGRRTAAAAR